MIRCPHCSGLIELTVTGQIGGAGRAGPATALAREAFAETPIWAVPELVAHLAEKGIDRKQTSNALMYLTRTGEITRALRGLYRRAGPDGDAG